MIVAAETVVRKGSRGGAADPLASATGHAPATRDAREQMVRVLYRVARRLWLASRDPEAIDPSGDDE